MSVSKVTLVGKPNSGKSSLFNLLTGLNQKVGNYSGVTVEKKSGTYNDIKITDLPGLNSIWTDTQDEDISRQAILDHSDEPSPILFVANGTQLNDSLILFSEIADLQVPMALVVNYKDTLDKHNVNFNIQKLSQQLNCPVVLVNSVNGEGLVDVKSIIEENKFNVPNAFCRSGYDIISNDQPRNTYKESIKQYNHKLTDETFKRIEADFGQRQTLVNKIVEEVLLPQLDVDKVNAQSRAVDKYILHPFWGILIFLSVMLLVFQAVFSFSSYPMDMIDGFFANAAEWINDHVQSEWLASLLSDGIIAGLGGVLIFIPQIAILFFLLGVLEHSGYLSRISHLSDRFLRQFGLSGKSIIPLMSSWACAIPAIMSARSIEDPKERLSVILASPLMTCSARLPVYTILIAILFPVESGGLFDYRGLALLAMYMIGVIATLLIALFISKRTQLSGVSLWTLELPLYRIPNWRNVFTNVYIKTKSFVLEAGKIIFLISIVLWVLASFSPKSEAFIAEKHAELLEEYPNTAISQEAVALEYSYAGYLGKFIEPVISPLGYDWKIGIALLTSFAAREVFVGTLSTIYSIGSEEEQPIIERLRSEVNIKTGEIMYSRATSISLLLFYAFALQCMSTVAIVRKESGQWRYAILQFIFFLGLAYLSALLAQNIF